MAVGSRPPRRSACLASRGQRRLDLSLGLLQPRPWRGMGPHLQGPADQVSILSPGVVPAHPRAQVVWIGNPEPASRTDRPAAGEVIIHHETVLARRYFETPITVR